MQLWQEFSSSLSCMMLSWKDLRFKGVPKLTLFMQGKEGCGGSAPSRYIAVYNKSPLYAAANQCMQRHMTTPLLLPPLQEQSPLHQQETGMALCWVPRFPAFFLANNFLFFPQLALFARPPPLFRQKKIFSTVTPRPNTLGRNSSP